MRIFTFDVLGYFAHFRKYTSTTSSLSYAFPPRTTIVGMIAAILGYERDNYYEIFSEERCRIALQVRSPIRRVLQTISYLMTDKPLTLEKLRGMSPPAQIRLELIIAEGEYPTEICYRIFFNHENDGLMDELQTRLTDGKFYYPPTLGTANSLARISRLQSIDAEIFKPQGEVAISTVIPLRALEAISQEEKVPVYIEELMPADFDLDRVPRRVEGYIYGTLGKPIKVRIKNEAFRCTVDGQEIIGTFM